MTQEEISVVSISLNEKREYGSPKNPGKVQSPGISARMHGYVETRQVHTPCLLKQRTISKKKIIKLLLS